MTKRRRSRMKQCTAQGAGGGSVGAVRGQGGDMKLDEAGNREQDPARTEGKGRGGGAGTAGVWLEHETIK